MGLGKKYYDIDTPFLTPSASKPGSGFLTLVFTFQSPTLATPLLTQFTTQINNSPSLNAPSIVWS